MDHYAILEMIESLEYNVREALHGIAPGPTRTYIHLAAAASIVDGLKGAIEDDIEAIVNTEEPDDDPDAV